MAESAVFYASITGTCSDAVLRRGPRSQDPHSGSKTGGGVGIRVRTLSHNGETKNKILGICGQCTRLCVHCAQGNMAIVHREVYECDECGWQWIPRKKVEAPVNCPNRECRSRKWNRGVVEVEG